RYARPGLWTAKKPTTSSGRGSGRGRRFRSGRAQIPNHSAHSRFFRAGQFANGLAAAIRDRDLHNVSWFVFYVVIDHRDVRRIRRTEPFVPGVALAIVK